MKKVNWDSYEAKVDGQGGGGLPAGAYVCRVTEAEDNEAREYVRLTFDVAEGERAGFFSDDYGKSHPWGHSVCLSYKESALPMTKGRLQTIADANPGFDPFAAWQAARLDMFRGRTLGVTFREEEWRGDDGTVRANTKPFKIVSPDDVRAGKVPTPQRKALDGNGGGVAASAPKAYADESDLPF